MGLYEFERDKSNLTEKYGQDSAVNEYARFVSKQRYGRQRQDADQGFQRQFPAFTGRYANQLGSGIQSGVFRDKLSQNVGDFNQGMDRLNQDEAGFDSNYATTQAARQGSFQQALLQLQEEGDRQRALADPFASYKAVY